MKFELTATVYSRRVEATTASARFPVIFIGLFVYTQAETQPSLLRHRLNGNEIEEEISSCMLIRMECTGKRQIPHDQQ